MEYVASNGMKCRIVEDSSPPSQWARFQWTAEDFDGAPDSRDKRYGYGRTREEVIQDIEDFILDISSG